MSRYLPPLADRAAETLRDLLGRVRALEARTATSGGLPLALTGQAGQVDAVFPGATNSLTVTVTFPVAFTEAPSGVFVSVPLLDLIGPVFAVGPPSAEAFQFVAQRRDGGNVSAGTRVCYWLAVA